MLIFARAHLHTAAPCSTWTSPVLKQHINSLMCADPSATVEFVNVFRSAHEGSGWYSEWLLARVHLKQALQYQQSTATNRGAGVGGGHHDVFFWTLSEQALKINKWKVSPLEKVDTGQRPHENLQAATFVHLCVRTCVCAGSHELTKLKIKHLESKLQTQPSSSFPHTLRETSVLWVRLCPSAAHLVFEGEPWWEGWWQVADYRLLN